MENYECDWCAVIDFCDITMMKLRGCMPAQGLPKGRETERFAQDLIDKMPSSNGAASLSQNQVRERQAAALAQRNAKYAMLSDDEDDFAPAMPAPTTAPLQKASKKSLRKAKVWLLFLESRNEYSLPLRLQRGVQAPFSDQG